MIGIEKNHKPSNNYPKEGMPKLTSRTVPRFLNYVVQVSTMAALEVFGATLMTIVNRLHLLDGHVIFLGFVHQTFGDDLPTVLVDY